MSADDHSVLIEIRERVARMETRQAYILELITDHKGKMDRIEQEAHGLKGRVWLISTIVFGVLAAAWEIVKNRLLGHP
ncbi:MAG: hypothetical protein EBR82_43745 [Caulobacteraceae bacterium]|nr:hypothetical protein [Caulobacteraceae bacterium]